MDQARAGATSRYAEHGDVAYSAAAVRGNAAASTSQLIRDAKGLAIELSTMLKRKDPWSRQVEFQREALRKAYLVILFSPYVPSVAAGTAARTPIAPAASSSKSHHSSHHSSRLLDVMNLLWLETSHAIIQVYRCKITELDRAIADASAGHRGGARSGSNVRGKPNGGGVAGAGGGPRGISAPGPTARRKLLHLFRTFLALEGDFFRGLLSTWSSSLAHADLIGLGKLGISVVIVKEEDVLVESRQERREEVVELAHKALICFGDLARYRELYNEPGAGVTDVRSGRSDSDWKGRGGGGGNGERKVKNWTRAAECYHQARLLLPDNGNPSNQLAVLSNYANDYLSAAYHYHRSRSLPSPSPTALTNLEITYKKLVTRWFEQGTSLAVEGDDGERFKMAFVVLHGMFFLKTRLADVAELEGQVQSLFKIAIQERLLSSDLIMKTIVTALCGLWNARTSRAGGSKKTTERSSSKLGSTPSTQFSNVDLEPHLLIHVLSLYRTLLSIGSSETDDLVSSNAASNEFDPASNISAILRRTLPSLRVLSKWIIGQLDYIGRVGARVLAKEVKSTSQLQFNVDGRSEDDGSDVEDQNDNRLQLQSGYSVKSDALERSIGSFWRTFADFSNSIRTAFPSSLLPNPIGTWLEEDVDLLGFAPLRKGMKEASDSNAVTEISRVGKGMHPNEEQLMRILDIQLNAVLIADTETTFISYRNDMFATPRSNNAAGFRSDVDDLERDSARVAAIFGLAASENDGEDQDCDEAIDDDPVDQAMRFLAATRMRTEADNEEEEGDNDDDEEEFVYTSLCASAVKTSESLPPPHSPHRNATRNAGDLLNLLLSTNTPLSSPLVFSPSAVLPTSSALPQSIWAGATAPPIAPSSAADSFESLPNMTRQAFDAPSSSHRQQQRYQISDPQQHQQEQLQQHVSSYPLAAERNRGSIFGAFTPFPLASTHPSTASSTPGLPLPASLITAQQQYQQQQHAFSTHSISSHSDPSVRTHYYGPLPAISNGMEVSATARDPPLQPSSFHNSFG